MKRYVNNFTRECDKYLTYKNEYIYTYLVEYDTNTYVFRTPGGTRGSITLDSNNIVKDIKFYDDGLYSEEVVEATKYYVGQKMEFEEDKRW